MAGSKKWVAGIAQELQALLGRDLALEAVKRMQKVPGANASAKQTLIMLHEELKA